MDLTRKQAISHLNVPSKAFDNYFKSSEEIKGFKKSGRWYFKKNGLDAWNNLRKERTIILSRKEYEECFEFAIKMAYGSKTSHGTGIRGVRSEVQMADDFILGILAELGVKKFLREKFGIKIKLDTEVHPGKITEQDIIGISENNEVRKPKIDIAIKSSKTKSCFNVIPPLEYENQERKSDAYIFVRVGLPSDHLFRILKNHSFFKTVSEYLKNNEDFKKIEDLTQIPIWICGFSYYNEFEKVTSIPGQVFDGYRYVKSVSKMHNQDDEWGQLIAKI